MHTTQPTLLQKLRDPRDQVAWNKFVELYTPLLVYWGRQRGLQTEDAADLVQDVLSHLVHKLPEFEYQPHKRFRNWLATVTRNKFIDRTRKRWEQGLGGDESRAEPIEPELDGFDEQEYRQYLVRRALEIVRRDYQEATWQACWRSVTTDDSAAEIAQQLNLTEGAVYAAKCRILRRLREELAGLIDD
ncbi:MAG: sigma-70 family RNA polymerase sigma factor [Planctomycetia bacterium]|nr:sigma-70 family RNA polymerase sigma factor [Planctomycetia bacterium]